MARNKTRAEKIESGYRLKDFSIKAKERAVEKDREEFGYLSSDYVKKDLTKTLLFTIIILGLLVFAQQYFGA